MLACRTGAVNPGAEFNDVQIDLQDSPFWQANLGNHRQVSFNPFSPEAAGGRQEQVLAELLGNRRCAWGYSDGSAKSGTYDNGLVRQRGVIAQAQVGEAVISWGGWVVKSG